MYPTVTEEATKNASGNNIATDRINKYGMKMNDNEIA